MTNSSNPPAGYPTLSVYMMANGAARVIDFAAHIFGGETIMRLDREDGSILHAAVRIGDSVVMLSDGSKDHPPFPVWLHVYVPDVDAAYERALSYGAEPVQAPSEAGDGDRRGGIKDAAGNTWWIATPAGQQVGRR